MPQRHYVLTAKTAADLREAQAWSQARWGKELTRKYFDDLHKGAEYVAQNQHALRARDELTAETALHVYPVRDHYLVYETLGEKFIVLVAVIRQGRDIPTILRKWAVPIRRELTEIRARITRGEISLPGRRRQRRGQARRKKF